MPTFDIEVPGGRTYRVEAPDGATQDDAINALKNQLDQTRQQSLATANQKYTTDSTALERFGGGMHRFSEGMNNLLGFRTPEQMQELDATDAPLKGGMYGLGEVAAGLPLTMAAGAAVPAAAGLGLTGAAGTAARVGLPLARAALQGGIQGAADAPDDKMLNDATTSALMAAGVQAVLGTGGRVITGLVQQSAAAKALKAANPDMFIPVSQAAGDDLISQTMKGVYKDVLPLIPGVPSRIAGQSAAAMEGVRGIARDLASPGGSAPSEGTLASLKSAFDQEYADTVGSRSYDVPQNFADDVAAKIRAAIPHVDDTTVNKVSGLFDEAMDRFSSGKPTIDGDALLNAKNAAASTYGSLKGVERAALTSGMGAFDDMIEKELSPTLFSRYQDIAPSYSAFSDLRKAGQNFTLRRLASTAKPGSPLASLASDAQATLGQRATGSAGSFGIGKLAKMAGEGAALLHNPVAAVGGLVGGNLAATKLAQRAVMGDTAAQQAIQRLLEAHPDMAAVIQTVVRNSAATQAGGGAIE